MRRFATSRRNQATVLRSIDRSGITLFKRQERQKSPLSSAGTTQLHTLT